MRRAASVGALAATLLWAGAAAACPVCFNAREETRAAFLGTTALLSLLPLGLIGGVLWWVRAAVANGDRSGQGMSHQDGRLRSDQNELQQDQQGGDLQGQDHQGHQEGRPQEGRRQT